ncbi:ribosome maturation factor RimP [Guyparkeria sp. SCN-R1]|nr:ribosome maturation factor RimP [Guyparkeria sp. SCN-R1]
MGLFYFPGSRSCEKGGQNQQRVQADVQRIPAAIEDMLKPVVEDLGFEWVGGEFRGGPSGLLRVYIDHPDGMTLEHCADVSRALAGELDVEDPFPGAYRLEVSSPGVERPMFRTEDFARFVGHRVRLRLYKPVAQQKKFEGVIQGVDGEDITVLVDEVGELVFRFEEAEKAHLVYEFADNTKRGRNKRKKRRTARK